MIDTSRAFRHTCTLFPGIGTRGRTLVPQAHYSQLDTTASIRTVSWGALEAACQILLGHVHARRDEDRLTLRMQDKGGQHVLSVAHREQGSVTWVNPGTTVRPYALFIAESVLLGLHPELTHRWKTLLSTLQGHGPLPLTEARLKTLSEDPAVKACMFALVDTLYFTAKLEVRAEIAGQIQDTGSYPHTPALLGQLTAVQGSGKADLSDEGRLKRRASSGVRALLIGPTGSGKTEMAKRVADAIDAAVHSIKGRPGLEDRDMIGFISPTPQGPQWVDGPLARALRAAMRGERTILIVDELLRLDPYHRNTLIGLMDHVSETELTRMLGVHEAPGRYYTLDLPGSGEILYASTRLLSVLCTTNAGSRYTQAGGIDPALMRRFQLTLFVDYPDEAQIMPVYEAVAGAGPARIAYALEVKTRSMTADHGQSLTEPMNIGTTLNFLEEVRALMDAGVNLTDALKEALRVTAVPFCCELGEDGRPDAAAAKSLEVELERLLRSGIARAA